MEYLLKASAVIILIYLSYKIFLQKETFFQSNRWFLLFGLGSAFLIPLLVIPNYITVELQEMASYASVSNTLSSSTGISEVASTLTFDWTQLIILLYLSGVLVLSIRFVIQLLSLAFLVLNNRKQKADRYTFVYVTSAIAPFSFFNYIVFNPNQFDASELEHILAHEKVHVKQQHSIDILLSHLASIVCWFNPIIWLYKKDLQQNLEFIADQQAQNQAACERSYQHLLLKTSVPNYQLALANNFYNSLIKKRIIMLHKSKSKKRNQLKMALILPLLALFVMSFNTKDIITYKTIPAEGSIIDSPHTIDDIDIDTKAEPIAKKEESTIVSKSQNTSSKTLALNTVERNQETDIIVVTKDTSDDELDEISKNFKKKGITIKFKNVKRNKSDEITSIDIVAKTKKSNATFGKSQDDAIHPITIRIDNDSISIDNGHDTGHRDYIYEIKDKKHKVHKSKSGKNVFVFSSDDEHGEDHEIIEDDDKIIIKSGKTIKEVKKDGKTKSIWVTSDDSDGDVLKIKSGKTIKELKKDGKTKSIWVTSDDGDGELFEIKTDSPEGKKVLLKIHEDGSVNTVKGENIWITNDDNDEDNIFEFDSGEGHIFISGNGKAPLYIVDGKEVKKEDYDLDPNKIESVNVLKGKAATEKYGKKGKDGVIIIKTKKN